MNEDTLAFDCVAETVEERPWGGVWNTGLPLTLYLGIFCCLLATTLGFWAVAFSFDGDFSGFQLLIYLAPAIVMVLLSFAVAEIRGLDLELHRLRQWGVMLGVFSPVIGIGFATLLLFLIRL